MTWTKLPLAGIIFHLLAIAITEPVQYCRFGHPDGEIDFCMGIIMHRNSTTDSHDLYLSMTVARSSALGWTAIGTGGEMAGSLMFIVYGDPKSGESPILSIRTADGHHQPRLVTPEDMGGADLRVLQADWMPAGSGAGLVQRSASPPAGPSGADYIAKLSVVCYACPRWPAAPIDALSPSQPWIWAWNDNQELDVFSFDAALAMHKHHAGNGGWGNFYVDMARSTSDAARRPSLPPLRPGVAQLGTSNTPIGSAGYLSSLRTKPLVVLHGCVMGAAFLFLFPLGVLLMRSGRANAFKLHWMFQLVSTAVMAIGVISGTVMSRERGFSTTHQWLGLFVALAVPVQGILGWRHHLAFIQIWRRTWISHVHIWMGRLVILVGWGNVLSGMILVGHGTAGLAGMSSLITSEAIALCMWLWIASRRAVSAPKGKADSGPATAWKRPGAEPYFAIEGSVDEDSDEDRGDIEKS
ncbi:hypothetical protein DL764_003512 [Monosporascus ibericus]|uniref:Cytochrome b561 domain-containing protein n=1 Tax=Monosporascus ibericus TaxID=155417 RepID=A0A4V1XBD5_9PEZI|nr:hypothetical protein DL764_003512 [Monosporascus ibericus]